MSCREGNDWGKWEPMRSLLEGPAFLHVSPGFETSKHAPFRFRPVVKAHPIAEGDLASADRLLPPGGGNRPMTTCPRLSQAL